MVNPDSKNFDERNVDETLTLKSASNNNCVEIKSWWHGKLEFMYNHV